MIIYASKHFIGQRRSRLHTSPVRRHLPAHGSVSGNYAALRSSAVVWLEDTETLAGQAVHRHEARLAPTLSLLRPGVHHAAGRLTAGLELTGIGLVGCKETERRGEALVFMRSAPAPPSNHPLGGAEERLTLMRSSPPALH